MDQAQNQAAQLANQETQQAFGQQTGYQNQLRGQLNNAVNGFQNPFINALSQLKAPNPNANTYTNVGMSGTPMYGGNGQPMAGAQSGTPTGAAAGGMMTPSWGYGGRGGSAPPGQQNMFSGMAQAQPVMRSAAAQ